MAKKTSEMESETWESLVPSAHDVATGKKHAAFAWKCLELETWEIWVTTHRWDEGSVEARLDTFDLNAKHEGKLTARALCTCNPISHGIVRGGTLEHKRAHLQANR